MNTSLIHDAILQLSQDPALDEGNTDLVFKSAVTLASQATGVERASIWLFNDEKSSIVCHALFLFSQSEFTVPLTELKKADFPSYFSFFESTKILSADDAHTHPNTKEFSKVYLEPLGINSMLDVPIKKGTKLVGVICFEHVGPKKTWSKIEITFASILSELVSKTLLAKEREKRIKEFLHTSRLASLGEMSTMLAHEINNPLAVAKGFIDLSIQELEKPKPELKGTIERLKKSQNASERISKIVQNLKLFGRIDDQNKRQNLIRPLIENALDLIRHRAHNFGIDLIVECEPDIEAYCSPMELSQVFVNLLSNAIDALLESSDKKKWIRIQVAVKEKKCDFAVANSGIKISTAISGKIFEPFFTTKPLGKGTGLGLKISQQIIQEHGGNLSLDPFATETVFRFSLPVV